MKRVLILLLFLSLASWPGWTQQTVRAGAIQFEAPAPGLVQGLSANFVGNPGQQTLYYWVTARYPSGISLPAGPARANSTVGIANLNGTNYVSISWRPSVGATGYDVIRLTTQQFPVGGACTNCVVALNQAGTNFNDQGGGVSNWPPAGAVFTSAATIRLTIDNLTRATPFLNISGSTGGGLIDTSGPISVGVPTPASVVNLSGITGPALGVGANISADFSTVTRINGGDFRARSIGGTNNPLVIGVEGVGTTSTGTVSTTELYGGNFIASHNVGTVTQMYGAVGYLDVDAAAGASTGVFATGLLGVLDDRKGVLTSINYPSAVMGALFDTNTTPMAAVIAYVTTDNIRTVSSGSAFKVVDRTTGAGHHFDYGLDLFYHCNNGVCSGAQEDNVFNAADIRLHSQAEILTGTGVPAGGLCTATNLGAIYLNHGGGGGTSLYVCEVAGNWAAK